MPLVTALADALARLRRRIVPAPYAALELATGGWIAAALNALCELGIPDALARAPQTAAQLAQRGYGDAEAIERLLLTLCAYGVVVRTRDNRFALTAIGETLTGEHSVAGMVAYANAAWHHAAYQHLGAAVRRGRSGFAIAHGSDLFPYLANVREAGNTFDRAMRTMSQLYGDALAAALDFSGAPHVLDVGGGDGTLLRCIRARFPDVRTTVFELAAVVENLGPSTDIAFVRGDVLSEPPPQADIYILSHVLHDWDDEHCVRILGNVARSMERDAKLIVFELIKAPPSNRWSMDRVSDLEMLAMLPGRERALEEYRALFTRAGLRFSRLVPTAAPESAIECVRDEIQGPQGAPVRNG